ASLPLGLLLLLLLFLLLLRLLLLFILLLDAAEARRAAAALRGRRPIRALGVEQAAQGRSGHRGGCGPRGRPEVLLAHVARVALPLQPFEVGEGGQSRLAQQARQGPRLVRPRQQHCVAAQNHGLVARLVAVHPGEHARVAAVRRAVGDARQQVGVRRPPRPRAPAALAGLHADAVGSQRQLHLGAPRRPAARPDLAHGVIGAAVALGVQGDGVAQVPHGVSGVLLVELHFLAPAAEDPTQALQGPVGQQVRARAQEGREQRRVGKPGAQALSLALGLILYQHELAPSPGQHRGGVCGGVCGLGAARDRPVPQSWPRSAPRGRGQNRRRPARPRLRMPVYPLKLAPELPDWQRRCPVVPGTAAASAGAERRREANELWPPSRLGKATGGGGGGGVQTAAFVPRLGRGRRSPALSSSATDTAAAGRRDGRGAGLLLRRRRRLGLLLARLLHLPRLPASAGGTASSGAPSPFPVSLIPSHPSQGAGLCSHAGHRGPLSLPPFRLSFKFGQ
uniref:Uncharacterized protein n=1 Tax=Sarcophilus harrisii TaxID=9305 RepID=A0A7N4NM52_SARHA